jgi:ABC-2 type transport system permease protein
VSSLRRIGALIYRHACMYRRSWPRVAEIAYWPTLNMLIWGFTSSYLTHLHAANGVAVAAGAMIGGVLLWEITLRAQLGVTIGFLEEIWSRNLGHLFVSPLRPSEMIGALMVVSALRAVLGLFPATIIAYLLYKYDLFAPGPVMLIFFLNLLVMGWWMALGIVSLLFRYGAGAEALAWTIAFGLTPLACVYYPLHALPYWLQPFAQALPAAHIFEGLRAELATGTANWGQLGLASVLNIVWIVVAVAVFGAEFRRARVRGALLAIGE